MNGTDDVRALLLVVGVALAALTVVGAGGGVPLLDGGDGRADDASPPDGGAAGDHTPADDAPADGGATTTVGGVAPVPISARVDGDRLVLDTPEGTVGFVAGVNLGATVPGHHPGEHAVTAAQFRRWFARMHRYGIHVIRVYTILSPQFYEALRDHNLRHPRAPIGVLHGVWIDEAAETGDGRDLYAAAVRDGFTDELSRAVRAVHGDARIRPRPGHASGTYTADVSPWLLGWVIGVEWEPELVAATDERNAGTAPYRGRRFRATRGATPTESWMASMLDHLAGQQLAAGRPVPLSFVNWATTDPLDHPAEPLEVEDLVGIDPMHVRPTRRWRGGYFASYHLYPYYPDFQRYEAGLRGPDGDGDPYAGYLRAIRRHHEGLPVVVAEFGIPSGPGIAHFGPLGRDQGGHSERAAMRHTADLLRTIEAEGLAGGLVFEWIDEWFKFSWNTIDGELPAERRPLWFNALTNESQFGMLAAVPGDPPPIVVDGRTDDWDGTEVLLDAGDTVVRATHDPGYLYLLLRLPDRLLRRGVTVGLDVAPGDGGGLPDAGARMPDRDVTDGDLAVTAPGDRSAPVHPAADVALQLGPDRARLLVRASNDPYAIPYGVARTYVPNLTRAEVREGNGRWHPLRLILNRPRRIPTTGVVEPVEAVEVGDLRRGPSAVAEPGFDPRNLWARGDGVVELRLPWAMVGLADPSSLQAAVVGADGTVDAVPTDGVEASLHTGRRTWMADPYRWRPWDDPDWHERPKRGLGALVSAMSEVTTPAPVTHRRTAGAAPSGPRADARPSRP